MAFDAHHAHSWGESGKSKPGRSLHGFLSAPSCTTIPSVRSPGATSAEAAGWLAAGAEDELADTRGGGGGGLGTFRVAPPDPEAPSDPTAVYLTLKLSLAGNPLPIAPSLLGG